QNLVPPFTGQYFVSHVYRCSTSLFLAGIVPGATVHLSDGGISLGSAPSVDGGAVVTIPSGVAMNARISASQIVSGSPGPTITSPRADDPPVLDAKITGSIVGCMTAITVYDIVDGAKVIVRSNADDPTTQMIFDAPESVAHLPTPPLVAGGNRKISVQPT